MDFLYQFFTNQKNKKQKNKKTKNKEQRTKKKITKYLLWIKLVIN